MLQMRRSLLLALLVLAPAAIRLADSSASRPLHYKDIDGDGEKEHDAEYDRERFLGKQEAEAFDQLSQAEALKRLEKLVKEKVDLDKDGFVTVDEMEARLKAVNNETLMHDLDELWISLNLSDTDLVTWEEHARTLNPGLIDESGEEVKQLALKAIEQAKQGFDQIKIDIPEKIEDDDKSMLEEFLVNLRKNRRRWQLADADNDNKLTKLEYASVIFAEDFPLMRQLLAQETLESMDSDKDGRVSAGELIADMWKPSGAEAEPEWLKDERSDFANKRDTNGDGFMDVDEVANWLDENSGAKDARRDAEHLVQQADKDKDGKLSLREILDSHETFAGSQAPDFVDDVHERDEL